jgi:predicted Zn finger-like uncharacterized protein
MALATRCPNCQVLFRVVADQLKLRGGLVRCGACRHVFDAIGSLTYIEDSAAAAPDLSAARKAAPPTLHATAVATPMLRTPIEDNKPRPVRPGPTPESTTPDWSGPPTLLAPPDAHGSASANELPREALKRGGRIEPRFDARNEARGEAKTEAKPDPKHELKAESKTERHEARAARDDDHAEAPAPPLAKRRRRREVQEEPPPEPVAPLTDPLANLALEETAEEPEFLRTSRTEETRSFSVVYGGGSMLLAALLLVQLAVIFRTDVVTRWPQWRPALVQVCSLFGCNVGWPTRAELLAVVGTELQAIPGTDVLELTAVVRNRAGFKVALPAIEVTLTDTTNRTLARKVFAPVDYLASAGEPSSRIDDGLGASSDLTIRVAFEARGINAVGFVVYPFYL